MAPESKKEKAPKRVNLLDDSDSDEEDGGADIATPQLKVNEEYAKRFEHNKKREELQRLEEKYKKTGKGNDDDDSDADSSSSDETEDEEGFLATEDLDAQISATLSAIKNKDPRVLDKNFSFFQEAAAAEATPSKKKEKPLFLKDYHREKILAGGVGASDDEDEDGPPPPQTYNQEQDALKKSIVSEINKAAESDNEDDFVQRKPGQEVVQPVDLGDEGIHPARAANVNPYKKKTKKQITEEDIANAEKDPELFLSNFMAARAWTEGGEHNWKAFESDEGEGDEGELYDKFEEAYNLRFEDPDKANQALKTYSREIVSARSVRKEAASSRKKQREAERERKEAEKQQRKDEKARLRKLKLEEAEEKLKKIKHAAGVSGKELKDEEWLRFLNDAWDDDKWEDEMKRRFGEDYYAVAEGAGSDSEEDADAEDGDDDKKRKKKKKPKKPTWDDDIDIKDIIPDFKDVTEHPQITLSDDETAAAAAAAAAAAEEQEDDDDEDEDGRPSKKRRTTKDLKKERLDAKKAAKAERAKLEALVDAKMDLDIPASSSSRNAGGADGEVPAFRYRETSPQAFGMTARDILLAPSDAALNSFAGLKKLATFRDEDKKRKDKKRLGKKARLRQWRREHFGQEYERTGPTFGLDEVEVKEKKSRKRGKRAAGGGGGGGDGERAEENADDGGAALDGESKKRKRSRGKKKADGVAEE
ncbi:Ribosome biogenesis protein Kri1 [Colletotrichum higginsianum IMI 349063]|uniref:Ribosome biogenesis protein Kri1 n=2 Tax=Colletotrichum higginsianum TaxID=80884 RepID=A0A1B7YNV4_COLHI|nr:Ribosome biogenesis protein Kri1 [Colletotrichum higginsianum IMI 349063]OBR13720.1 Ribosome biogenesis protein Kri1 [Colletotrichum higginsianum IMI 349063]TID01918.1 Protein kri1 [Colletotrichum higginsianum]GJC95618.1 ribosome biogenesis protein Kri1 [Colletotrichum higginsianum]